MPEMPPASAAVHLDACHPVAVIGRPAEGTVERLRRTIRRFRALKLLEERGEIAGDYAVPAEIRKLSQDERLRLATVENVQRENLPPLDEAAAFAALIRKGASLDDLAAKTGLSATTIRRRLVLNDLCEEAKAALCAGEIGLAQVPTQSAASEPDPESAYRARPDERDTNPESKSEQEPGHCDPSATRKARDSLTGNGASAAVVRAGREPAVSIGPLAVNEIRQVTTA